ncbi:hypothetical protein [uncultured Methanobrevibacter sp.]|uniref:hypothetical protein n=1 Tax=uncultured Methanobrevibacter sp. TaxID=253161 RepID=UPI0025EC57A4|nr:hypothetical protein [uncultured Methanobrevibacter sp.]
MVESADVMYSKEGIPTDGCNLEIMGYPFYADNVSPNEAYRRREYNFSAVVGGTQDVTPGAYVGLDFTVTTHVFIDPDRPDEWNSIFQEMMSKPVEVVSPDLGGRFKAIVVIKPERDKLNTLKLTISVKEVPDSKSLIPGEEFSVPKTRKVQSKKTKTTTKKTNTKKQSSTITKLMKSASKNAGFKNKTITKKSKSKGK